MRRTFIKLLKLSTIIVFTFAFLYIVISYPEFQRKARAKEGLTLLNILMIATQATEAESGSYKSMTFDSIGFNPGGTVHYNVALRTADILPKYLPMIPPAFLADIEAEQPRVGAYMEIDDGLFHFCRAEPKTRKVECIYVAHEYKSP